jgi:hypothetical protein
VSTAPPELGNCKDIHEFKTKTLMALLADENLRLISIWSPTFLTTLLDDFLSRRGEILDALRRTGGAVARQRADFLRCTLPEGAQQISFASVWPKLQLISCWTHGSSEIYAESLQGFFPNVEIQGKGLIATEAFVSLPFREEKDPVLAVTSHFFEFQDTADGNLFLAHELVVGKTYRVIVTTGGGLYRYALGDVVRVTGFIQDAPCFRFIGRTGNVSDLFGEKLQGAFVEDVIRCAFAKQNLRPRFFLLAPVSGGILKPAYTLFIDIDTTMNAAALQEYLEEGLAQNFHYTHCRRLGQLSSARVFQITRGTHSSETVFHQELLARGIRFGDIKMGPLDYHLGWDRRFRGQFVT